LLSIEKQTRNGGDAPSTGKILVSIVELCFELKDLKSLNENIVLLSKRRGQLKQSIKMMVKKAMTFLDKMDYEHKLELIDTLRKITDGKIFVEKQRARLTLILAHIREKENNVVEAANLLQEVQVETFGAMKKQEKTNYILEQMRLCLLKKDYVRAQIMSRKITPKLLEDKEFQDQKIIYYTSMLDYFAHEGNFLDQAKAYQSMYNTPKIQLDATKWQYYLKHVILLLVLPPHDNEQSDFINRINLDVKLNELPVFKTLVRRFLTPEVIRAIDFKQLSVEKELTTLEITKEKTFWETLQKKE